MRSFVSTAPGSFARVSLIGAAAVALLGQNAFAQNYRVEFSVDWQGPTVGKADSLHGLFITEGDVLFAPAPPLTPAFGPLAAPAIFVKAGPLPALVPAHLGLAFHPPCYGHLGGTPCRVEVDALALGTDLCVQPNQGIKDRLLISVDKYAVGFGAPTPPSIATEAPIGEVSADVLSSLGLGVAPLAPFAGPLVGSTGNLDGDGLFGASAFLRRGLGLIEPNVPFPILPATGDNLDALMLQATTGPVITPFPPGGIYFSLDSAFPDPLTGFPNTGSAAAHGFVGGDVVLTAAPGGPPVLYAPAGLLGLDFIGPDRDDLDALILCENGAPGYQPSLVPYDWAGGPLVPKDMLLFSVRRGSAVIGLPDSIFGIPIEEGDILTRPVMGGLSPFPGIFVAAENLGLATSRSMGFVFGDELDAADMPQAPLYDCNGNGREDVVDIALGGSADSNRNGIPDECEMLFTQLCFCPNPLGPCGNDDPTAGCKNSAGTGALTTASGTTSVATDDLVLTTTGMPTFKSAISFYSFNLGAPVVFYDGRRCLFAPIQRLPLTNSGATGSVTYGPGLAASEGFVAGNTVGFQVWYRDPTGPCGTTANLSSAVRVTFTP